MANYLQRVAISGARTSSSIKPPAAAPPLVPDSAISGMAPQLHDVSESVVGEHSGSLTARSPQRADTTPAPAEHGLVQPASLVGNEQVQPLRDVLRATAPMMSDNVVHAPKGLRREPAARADSNAEVKPAAGPATPRTPDQLQEGGPPSTANVPVVAADASITTLREAQAPREVTPPEPASSRRSAHSEVLPAPQPLSTIELSASPLMANRAEPSPKPQPIPGTQGVEPRVLGRATTEALPAPDAKTAGERRRSETVAVSAAASARPLPMSPRAADQNKINIGRIEVQVNNTAPQVTRAEPAPVAQAARLDFLEARYLNRFAMKP